MNTSTINQDQLAEVLSTSPIMHQSANGRIKHTCGVIYVALWGITEIKFNDTPAHITPWHYAQWVPAGVEHECLNARAHNSYYICISNTLVNQFPLQPSILEMNNLSAALVSYLINGQAHNVSPRRDQLIQTLLTELLTESHTSATYLPLSQDKLLNPVLQALLANPGDNRSLMELAQTVQTSEKTLIRRFRSELNLSFREWRSRLRFISALKLLASPLSIAEIAQQLGYRHTSSFIFTFHKMTGTTPDNYRKAIPERQAHS